MRTTLPLLRFLGGSIAVLVFLFLAIHFLSGNISQDVKLTSELSVAVVAGSATIIVSVITVVAGKYFEKKREIELQHREKKVEIYEKFMEKWFEALLSPKLDSSKVEEEFTEFLREFTRKLILWGSNGVIEKYSRFRRETDSSHSDPRQFYRTLCMFEKILFEIRRDLGNSSHGLKEKVLLALFIEADVLSKLENEEER